MVTKFEILLLKDFCFLINNSRKAIAEALSFLQFNESKLYGGLSFNDLFRHFHDFWSQIEVILVTPEQEVEQKSEWFCVENFSPLL